MKLSRLRWPLIGAECLRMSPGTQAYKAWVQVEKGEQAYSLDETGLIPMGPIKREGRRAWQVKEQ